MSDIEPPIPLGEQAGSSYRISSIRPGDKRFDEWLAARHAFMLKRGWVTGETGDLDIYDANPQTHQFVAFGEKDELAFGMRLTKVQGFENSLSWSMVQGSSIPEIVVSEGKLDPKHQIWDLTRLVPGESAGPRAGYEAIPLLFGEALRECVKDGDENPLWIFVFTQGVQKWLERQGVEVTVLGEEKMNGDEEISVLGCIEPAKLAELQDSNAFARRAMKET